MVDGVNQQPGLFQRIGNFFGGDDPNAGQPTDPFAGLSRPQRTMLGFAALRDAAASLEGRDSNFFQSALGGFEQARDRERLRAQGEMQNRVGALQALATLNDQMRYNQAFGLPIDPATEALRQALMTSAGLGSGATPMAGGAPVPTAVAPAVRPATGGAVVDASGAVVGDIGDEPLSPATQAAISAPATAPTDRLAQIDAEIASLTQAMTPRVAVGAGVADLQAQIDQRVAERERLMAEAAATAETQADIDTSAAQAEGVILPEVDQALDFLVRGFDAEGNVIFNPALVTRAGRVISGALEGPEYQNFVGAIETLKTGVLLDALSRATVGALSEGEMRALSAEQGMLDPANPIGTFRALNNIERIARQSIERRNREAGIAPDASVPSVSWD